MGDEALPPISLAEVLTRWQFAPVVTAFVVVAAGLYLWGVLRVRRRHPARPWPAYRTALFLAGLAIIVIATQSGIGSYDDVLFWDHMVQHLLLLMVAPPLLVVGQPATLLLHASRNPLHTWTKKVLRSRVMAAITWPPFGVALYVAVIVGTHLTGFMNVVETNGTVHDFEHALYLIAGYLYFLPLVGREPIRWRVSYPSRIFLLFIAMPVDAFTGLVLGSEGRNPFPGLAEQRPRWAPDPLSDVHIGGAVMWVGGAGIMFGLVMAVFFAWSAPTAASAGSSPRAGRTSPPWSARIRAPAPVPACHRRPRRPAVRNPSTTMSTSPRTTPSWPGSISHRTADRIRRDTPVALSSQI
jgi:cytochrome c oxidase assembly factor CtaG